MARYVWRIRVSDISNLEGFMDTLEARRPPLPGALEP